MHEVAIIGAGELGGLLAHRLARSGSVRSIRLIDETARVAEGQALDIAQAGAVEGFAATVSGSTNVSDASAADVVVLADRRGAGEWEGDEGRTMLGRLARFAPHTFIVCAGSSSRPLIEWGVRERRVPRDRMV